MNTQAISDEELNAFVDGQLNAADQARVLEAINRDTGLQRRVAEYQQTKALLRHAYEHPPLARTQPVAASSRTWQALAATLLLSLGITAGWFTHSFKTGAAPTLPTLKGVVIQVSEADPAKWEMALINARNVRKAYGDKPMDVVIVAYGPGLKMLRKDSPVSLGLEDAQRDGVKLLACGNTMRMTNTTREDLNWLVDVVPAGIVEIIQKQSEGYAYVRP